MSMTGRWKALHCSASCYMMTSVNKAYGPNCFVYLVVSYPVLFHPAVSFSLWTPIPGAGGGVPLRFCFAHSITQWTQSSTASASDLYVYMYVLERSPGGVRKKSVHDVRAHGVPCMCGDTRVS